MTKAIIFDLWLTLGTKNVGISNSLREKFNIEKTDDFMHLYEKAVQLRKWSSEEEMAKNFLEVLSIEEKPGDVDWIISLFREGIEKATMYPGMKELLLELKKDYKIGFISNTTVFESVVLDKWEIRDIFDVVSFSWEVEAKKPTKEIFDITLEKLEVLPNEAIFIDDGQKNIDAALSYGLRGIQFVNFEQFKSDLYKLLKNQT
jgi:putative hydrolase of the HAD superfamily